MITCKKCGFNVNGNLVYSIKNNICPSCGTGLMNNLEIKKTKEILNKLRINNILQNISNDSLYILSIFILTEFLLDDTEEYVKQNVESEEYVYQEDEDAEGSETKLRSSIRDEYVEKMSAIDEEIIDEDEDDRVKRLKSLAKASPMSKRRGIAVSRIGG